MKFILAAVLAVLSGAFLMACKPKKKDEKKPEPGKPDNGAKDIPIIVSFLGARNVSAADDIDRLIAICKKYQVKIGFKYFEGALFAPGIGGPNIEKMIRSGVLHTLVISGAFARPKTKQPDHAKSYASIDDEKAKAKAVIAVFHLAKANGITKLYYVLVTEDDEKNQKKKTDCAMAVRKVFQEAGLIVKLIHSTYSGIRGPLTGFDVEEHHGEYHKSGGPGFSYDPDGTFIPDMLGTALRAINDKVELVAVWHPSFNGSRPPDEARNRTINADFTQTEQVIAKLAGGVVVLPPVVTPKFPPTDTFVDGAKRGNLYKPVADNFPQLFVVIFHPKYTDFAEGLEINGKVTVFDRASAEAGTPLHVKQQGIYTEDGSRRVTFREKRPKSGSLDIYLLLKGNQRVKFHVPDVNQRFD